MHAGSPIDMWHVTMAIAQRAGGDPGHPAVFCPMDAPEPIKPQQLVVMETDGWTQLDAATLEAFERVLEALRGQGVTIIRRGGSTAVESFERGIATIRAVNSDLCAFENRAAFENLVEQHPGKLSARTMKVLERGRAMSLEDYRQRLREREEGRQRLLALAPLCDGLISLSSPGPAPIHDDSSARPTGDAIFNYPSSTLGAPAVTVPLIGVSGMPVGVQIMGQLNGDARVAAIARWLGANVAPVQAG
ncbi:MAG: amidase [Betaproteobacteria bacterium]|nr:amidase [Betaproteobacteria bacterium]